MNIRISEHVEKLFVGVAHTKQAAEIKEELLANLNAKYDDLLSRGMSDDEAFNNVTAGIGNIQSLLGDPGIASVKNTQSNRQLSGALAGFGVMLYILAICAAIFFGAILHWGAMAGLSFLSLTAIATGVVIWAANIAPKKYHKGDDTFVEEYKEKVTGGSRENRLRGAVSSTLWLLIVIVYLGVSFVWGNWHVTWLIFVAGALINNLIMYMMGDPGKGRGLLISTLWLAAVIGYFLIGFYLGHWVWGLMVFLIAAAVQQLIRLVRIWSEV
ncbi:hypothetical protein FACS1894208_12260 [Clostridia bacterium]|nr:hypothetical protein FACS1894208_12260 [Clostridia bacterium]